MHQAEADSTRGRILVIDDDDLFRESLSTNLTDAGFSTDAFGEGLTAIRHLEQKSNADLVLLRRESLELHTVIAMGRILVAEGILKARGTFEPVSVLGSRAE